MLIYVGTMAPGVLWGDSGDCQVRVLSGEIHDPVDLCRAHAPFYAVAIRVKKVFNLEAAYAANLTTAVAGAATVGNLSLILCCLLRRRTAIAAGVLLFALSHTFWQLAAGAEVTTFSTMFLSLELLAAVRLQQTGAGRWLLLAAFANGMGWATHNIQMLTWPAWLFVFVRRLRAGWRPREIDAILGTACWLAGTLPLLVVLATGLAASGSLPGAVRSLLVGRFSDSVFNLTITGGMLARVAGYLLLSFPTPLILAAPYGWWVARGKGRGLWWFLTLVTVSLLGFALRYNVPDQYTFMVHAYLLLVVFTAIGLEHLLDRIRWKLAAPLALGLACLAPLIYALMPNIVENIPRLALVLPKRTIPYRDPVSWFLQPWRCGYTGAERYAREVLQTLPEGAVLLAGDTIRRPLDYVQGQAGIRRDVVIPQSDHAWSWQPPREYKVHDARVDAAARRLFTVSRQPGYVVPWLLTPEFELEPFELIYRVILIERSRLPVESTPISRPTPPGGHSE